MPFLCQNREKTKTGKSHIRIAALLTALLFLFVNHCGTLLPAPTGPGIRVTSPEAGSNWNCRVDRHRPLELFREHG